MGYASTSKAPDASRKSATRQVHHQDLGMDLCLSGARPGPCLMCEDLMILDGEFVRKLVCSAYGLNA